MPKASSATLDVAGPLADGRKMTPSPRRNFVINHYKALKGANPTLPILVRECAGVEPKLWARFGALAGLSA